MEQQYDIIREIIALKDKFNSDEQIEAFKEVAENVRKFEEITTQKSEELRKELRSKFLSSHTLFLHTHTHICI
jgi:hypothetical protein